MKTITDTVVKEITEVLEKVDSDQAVVFANELQHAKRIFIAGTGRSGAIGKMLAMRLMHMDFTVYVVGESITPSIESSDLLLIISGSGNTASLKEYAKKAKEIDTRIALVTTNEDSPIGKLSDCSLRIPAATKNRHESEPDTIQPLGSQFDQSVHLLLDGIVVYLLQQQAEQRDNSSLFQKHANLE
ncbi:6-phospho-3-hexuloisomerase [Virgibacillus necropolis]|uniref:6-phospho-3-hexuloisomerase n=1 Tax=Virgibacillus necropolis TaxID=163877 RepID=A0A221M9U4_9BACI|nr:6-phospho-3-hexuloisomerase [Virgibacillus necropolis]ASN04438.1 6-phospho-3-hexuloisomerase [Virgibacillus necropolis]